MKIMLKDKKRYQMVSGECIVVMQMLMAGIDDNDRIIWGNHAGKKGYNPGDLNMDGQINNNDKNDMIIPNNNSQSQIPE